MAIAILIFLISFYWVSHQPNDIKDKEIIGSQPLLLTLLIICASNLGFSILGLIAKNRRDHSKNQIFQLYLIILIIFYIIYLIIIIANWHHSYVIKYFCICCLIIYPCALYYCNKLGNLLKGINKFIILVDIYHF